MTRPARAARLASPPDQQRPWSSATNTWAAPAETARTRTFGSNGLNEDPGANPGSRPPARATPSASTTTVKPQPHATATSRAVPIRGSWDGTWPGLRQSPPQGSNPKATAAPSTMTDVWSEAAHLTGRGLY